MDNEDLAARLAVNIRQLRETRGLTQVQIARTAKVPRATWSNLESGTANPTLSVLHRVAGALSVTTEELIARPRAAATHHPAHTLVSRVRGDVTVRKLLPDALPGLDQERMELPPGGRMIGSPHTPGTREYLTCESGSIELTVSGDRWTLSPGDVVVFRGDQRHAYFNPDKRVPAVAYSTIVLASGL